MSRVHFYATTDDLAKICEVVASKLDLKILPYFSVPEGDFLGRVVEYGSFEDVPDLGRAPAGDRIFCPAYVLIDQATPITPLTIEYPSGSQIKREVEMSATLSEAAVEFRPAGEFGDDAIILGEVMSHMPSKESEKIVRTFRAAMKKHFGVRARGAWVGPGALERLKAGTRLTAFYAHPKREAADIQLSEIEPQEAVI